MRLVAGALGRRARIVRVSPALTLLASKTLGVLVTDVVLTRDEIAGLMAGLLVSPGAPTVTTRPSQWLRENAATLGARYASELERRDRP